MDTEDDVSYYTIDSYNDMLANSECNFNIFHMNIRSFCKNSDELCVFLEQLSSKPDVLVLTETWFSCDLMVELEGYCGYHTYRMDRRGGGVSVYVKAKYKSIPIPRWTFIVESHEICSVNIDLNGTNVIVYGIYRPPDRNILTFVSDIAGLFTDFKRDDHVFIVGDLNVDIISPTPAGEEFLSACFTSTFLPLINVPTHVSNNVSSCLDHIWYNKLCNVRSGAFDVDITDHYIIFSSVQLPCGGDQFFTKLFRDHSRTSLDAMNVELQRFVPDFDYILANVQDDVNVDDLVHMFTTQLYGIYNRCCHIRSKRISYNRYLKPWITDNLLSCIRRKHYLYRLFKRGELTFDYYNAFKNQVTKLIRRVKLKYYSDKFKSNFSDSSATWKTVNSLIGKKKKKSVCPLKILSNDRLLTEPIEIANCLNDFFANIGSQLDSSIPQTDSHALHFLGDRSENSFFIRPVLGKDVRGVIDNFKSNSCPLYGLPTFILKCYAHVLCDTIAELFNVSVRTASFPSILKISRIIPLFKSGIDTVPSNYRPISILSDFSKIFERLMYVQLSSYIDSHRILCNAQFGFRKNSSTSDAIIEFLDSAFQTLNAKRVIVAVLLDFSKAFDTVKHNILLDKLEHLGVRGHALGWFRTYLSGRSQYVSLDDVNSSSSPITMGVPQGSILGPLLFLLYINDMSHSSRKLKFVHFADDTTVFHSGSDINDVIAEINSELLCVRDWLHCNRLSLNVGKTSYMVFTDRKVQDNITDLCIADISVQRVSEAKFLGVVIDENLNFKHHVSSVAKAVSRSIGIMNRISYLIPLRIRKILYYSMIFSRVIYGVVAWGGSGSCNASTMEKLLRRARRSVARSEVNVDELTSDLLTFKSIYEYFTAIKLYKIVKMEHHQYFHQIFRDLTPSHNHDTRFSSGDNYNVPHFAKTKCHSSFLFRSIGIWNRLTENTKASQNLISFKRSLKRELLQSQVL